MKFRLESALDPTLRVPAKWLPPTPHTKPGALSENGGGLPGNLAVKEVKRPGA